VEKNESSVVDLRSRQRVGTGVHPGSLMCFSHQGREVKCAMFAARSLAPEEAMLELALVCSVRSELIDLTMSEVNHYLAGDWPIRFPHARLNIRLRNTHVHLWRVNI
jgi:hypothetical protein